MHIASSKTKNELCTFSISMGIFTASQVGLLFSLSLTVCVCVCLLSIYLCTVLFDLCVASFLPPTPTHSMVSLAGSSHLIFQAGAFSFHFFVKHVTQILAELPQRRPCKHLALLPLPLPLPLYAASAATVTVTGRKCNSTSASTSCPSTLLLTLYSLCPVQSSPVQSIPFRSVSFHVSLLPVLAHTHTETHRVGVACLSHV